MFDCVVVDSKAHSIQGKIDMTECHCWVVMRVTRQQSTQDTTHFTQLTNDRVARAEGSLNTFHDPVFKV